jgi:hypothetical protein
MCIQGTQVIVHLPDRQARDQRVFGAIAVDVEQHRG